MKTIIMFFYVALIILFSNCGDNKAATASENEPVNNPTSDKKEDATLNSTAEGDDIIGEWEWVGLVVDTNDNLQIDDDERKKLEKPGYENYMKLNRDGSGLFTIAKMEGRYEIKKDENNGRNVMTWYDKANGPHRVGSIMKVTKNELTIKEPGSAGLFLWKRL